ncbi:MAG: MoxR family ATPase [Mariprofundales bacterium]
MTTQTAHECLSKLRQHMQQGIIGQEDLVDRLMIALLADGHLLVEGAPGLAKTRAVRLLADGIAGDFHRVQFTPDLLPADLTGTEIFQPTEGNFRFQQGPLFNNLVLADEINRAPVKVQSALLEAMAERQVTIGRITHHLPELFLVMATQNPIEQEGTYPLPEAQLDRFLMHVNVGYPPADQELSILRLARNEAANNQQMTKIPEAISQETLFTARKEVLALAMVDSIEDYIVRLILATRNPPTALAGKLDYGASPRATIALDRCARAHAWLNGRDFVSPEDVQYMAYDVLRHRLLLSYAAQAEGNTPDNIISVLLQTVAVP